MSAVLDELLELLRLNPQPPSRGEQPPSRGEQVFYGGTQDPGWGRIFGGQVLGQALSAATQTVPVDRQIHSLHGYFLRPGSVDTTLVFRVDPIRDGRSFTTRRVVAEQNGEAIFSLSASFQIPEGGFDHQSESMPDVKPPDELRSERELASVYLEKLPEAIRSRIPRVMQERAIAERPIEIRLTQPTDPMFPPILPPRNQLWFRAAGRLPDDPATHRYLLAYASDYYLLAASMLPHGVTWMTPGLQVASLDHTMYFHRPFRFDDWLLYDIRAPTAVGARGLARGRWFDRDGTLVASTIQEGLIRDRRG